MSHPSFKSDEYPPPISFDFDELATCLPALGAAGLAYPTIAFLLSLPILLFHGLPNWEWADVGRLLFVAIAFGLACSAWAMGVGIFVLGVALLIHVTTRRRMHPRLLTMAVGGSTGYWCVALWPVLAGTHSAQSLMVLLPYALLAMIMAQYASARFYSMPASHYKYQGDTRSIDERLAQFGLRDLFVLTLWMAILLGLSRNLPLSGPFMPVSYTHLTLPTICSV